MFARLRELAEGADGRRQEGTQLRRQATFSAAYDPTPTPMPGWLLYPPPTRSRGSGRLRVAARSRAVTEAARGNPERLRWFIDRRLAGNDWPSWPSSHGTPTTTASFDSRQTSDVFMVGNLPAVAWRPPAGLAGRPARPVVRLR